MSILTYLLLLGNPIFDWTQPEAEALREQPMSLGNQFLVFVFGLLHSLGQKFSIFCGLFFISLCTLFLQSNALTFAPLDVWGDQTLNLGVLWSWVCHHLCLGAFSPHIGGHCLL